MGKGKEKNKAKWEPALKVKPSDGIKSSDYTHAKPFIPSYETEEHHNMGYIMSMEYAKIWQREREELEKPIVQDTKYLPKKFIIRGLNKKKQEMKRENLKKENPQLKMKQKLK